MTTITHSPLPFATSPIKSCVLDAKGCVIAVGALGVFNETQIPEREANVEFIVRACNMHDEMVATLRIAEAMILLRENATAGERAHALEEIRISIAKAKEQS